MTPEQFMGNFGAIAEAPGGMAKLRDLVLALAVRGRLSEREEGDGSVEEVFATPVARAVKERLSEDLQHYPEAFDLPEGWVWTTIDRLAGYVQRGKGPKYADKSSVPVVSQKCVQWSGFDIGRARWVQEASLANYGEERFLLPGDLLWNSTGTGTVGRINVLPDLREQYPQLVADSHVTVVRVDRMEPRFLWCWLAGREVQDTIEHVATGTTKQKELGRGTIRSYPVPVSPLAEQKRIVAKVDQLMVMLDDLEQRQEKKRTVAIHVSNASLDCLVNAEDPDQLARAWERVSKNFGVVAGAAGGVERLRTLAATVACFGGFTRESRLGAKTDSVCDRLEDLLLARRHGWEEAERQKHAVASSNGQSASTGRYREPNTEVAVGLPDLPPFWIWTTLDTLTCFTVDYRGKTPPLAESGIPVLSAANVRGGVVVLDTHRRVSEATYRERLIRGQARPGDLVITTEAPVAKVALFPSERCLLTRRVLACQLVGAEPQFLLRYFRTATAKLHIERHIRGSTAPRILKPDLLALPVPLPPLGEQRRIVAKVDQLMAMLDDLESKATARQSAGAGLAVVGTCVR